MHSVPLNNLNELARGALAEKFEKELSKVLANVYDPNTDEKKARKVVLTLTIKPGEKRQTCQMIIDATSVLAPAKPVGIPLFLDKDAQGNVIAAELREDGALNGQQTLGGGEVRNKVLPIGKANEGGS